MVLICKLGKEGIILQKIQKLNMFQVIYNFQIKAITSLQFFEKEKNPTKNYGERENGKEI